MADDLGLKIGLDGEKVFRQSIKGNNAQFRALGSEMNAVSARFGSNEKSAEALTARNTVPPQKSLTVSNLILQFSGTT